MLISKLGEWELLTLSLEKEAECLFFGDFRWAPTEITVFELKSPKVHRIKSTLNLNFIHVKPNCTKIQGTFFIAVMQLLSGSN